MICATFGILMLPTKSVEASAAAAITLTVGVTQTVDSLNPFGGALMMSGVAHDMMYETLVGLEGSDLSPRVAESWSSSNEGTMWTFNIRHGMTWHDGVSVTAEDVNWTYNLILKNPALSVAEACLENVTDVRALDNYTIRVTTDIPVASMPAIPLFIVPKHLWINVPANKIVTVDVFDTTYFPNGPIGSGPFRLVDYAVDDFVRFARYEDYYGRTIHFDELVYKIFLSEQAMLNAFYAGSIDYTWSVPASAWQTTIDMPNIDGQTVREICLDYLAINVCPIDLRPGGASRNYETLNLSVRQAMGMATNKSEIVRDALLGLGDEGDVLIPSKSTRWHYNLTETEEYKFDIAAANSLLDASGYVDIDGDGIRENDTSGVKLDFVFEYPIGYTYAQTAAFKIEDWYAKIGIRAAPQGVTESGLFGDWIGMKYDLLLWGWYIYGYFDPSYLLAAMTTEQIPSGHNDWLAWSTCFYSNPYYDMLYSQSLTAVNVSARQAMAFEMQQILYRDSPYIVLDYAWSLYAYRTDRFTNWQDLNAHPSFTNDRLLFFELIPVTDNLPPQNVNAGLDTTVAIGEARSLTGYAEDEDVGTLNWTWRFTEPGGAINTRYEQTISYTFNNLGTVTVALTVRDSGGLETQDMLTVTVQQIQNAGYLVGHVTDSGDGPIVAATVTAGTSSATTNATGCYGMTLSAGEYNVTADAEGYRPASQTAVVVEGEATMLNFSLMSSSGSVKGCVYDEDTGDPIEDAIISLWMGNVNKLAISNSTGAFRILLLEVGTYSVNVTRAGYETKMTQITIHVGQETVLDMYLKPSGKVDYGLSTAALTVTAAIVVVIVSAAVVLTLMKRKQGEAPPPPPEAPKT